MDDESVWERDLVGEDPPAELAAEIARTVATLAARRWLGLGTAAAQRRFMVVAAADTALEVYLELLRLDGYSRSRTDPWLIVRVLKKPVLHGARRNREGSHVETLGVRSGRRLGLELRDWLYRPRAAREGGATLSPQLVTVAPDEGDESQWLVEVGYYFVFEDGWVLRPAAVDILAREIRLVEPLDLWDGAREMRTYGGVGQVDLDGEPERLTLREVGVEGRIAANPRVASSAPVRLVRAKYYRCPGCGRRSLVTPQRLAPDVDWKTPASTFPPTIKNRFDGFRPVRAPELAFDLRCRGCRSPVRLIYEYSEVGMGGPWHPVIKRIVEVASVTP